MEPEKVLDLGSKYSKKDLSSLLDQPNLSFVREGIFNCKNSIPSDQSERHHSYLNVWTELRKLQK